MRHVQTGVVAVLFIGRIEIGVMFPGDIHDFIIFERENALEEFDYMREERSKNLVLRDRNLFRVRGLITWYQIYFSLLLGSYIRNPSVHMHDIGWK